MKIRDIMNFEIPNKYLLFVCALFYSLCLLFWTGLVGQQQGCCSDIGVLQHPFYFEPYLSLWIANFLHSVAGYWPSVILGRVILPTAVLCLLVAIYSRHVSILWAITLGLLAVSFIDDYPFRDFLAQIYSTDFDNLGSARIPELMYFPIPSLSTFYFLLIFYFSTKSVYIKPNIINITFFTLCFSTIVYVNAIDAIFGLAFWFLFFTVRWIRQKFSKMQILIRCGLQVFIVFVVIAPALVLGQLSGVRQSYEIDLYSICAYFLVPLFLIAVLFAFQRIDIYELLYNFRHVYVIMATELILILLSVLNILSLDLHIARSRIVQFFAHTYYYLPIIYFSSRPIRDNAFGSERFKFSKNIRLILHLLFKKISPIYLIIIIILLFAYNIASGLRFYETHQQQMHTILDKTKHE